MKRPNEINVAIPYSLFCQLFNKYIIDDFHKSKLVRLEAIENVKRYWLYLDSEQRGFVNQQAQKQIGYYPEFQDLIAWIAQNRQVQHTASQPLMGYVELPVVNIKK